MAIKNIREARLENRGILHGVDYLESVHKRLGTLEGDIAAMRTEIRMAIGVMRKHVANDIRRGRKGDRRIKNDTTSNGKSDRRGK